MMGYRVKVCEPGAAQGHWPQGVNIREMVYTESPWPLPNDTHSLIARGHKGDAASVAALLNHGAQHIYLIASAKRAQSVIVDATPQLMRPDSLAYLSAPAGLDLGGDTTMEIAFSILTEIQVRHYGKSGHVLIVQRAQRADVNKPARNDRDCLGKRV
jgi:xanthine dehydrogenase accessory factor